MNFPVANLICNCSYFFQLYTVDLNNADDCAAKFRSNTGLGFVMFIGIVTGTLMKTQKNEKDQLDDVKWYICYVELVIFSIFYMIIRFVTIYF